MATLGQRRSALQAADDLLNDLEIDQESPVDVFDIVDRLGLWLVFNRLKSLLGAVVPKGNGGIMLSTQRGPSVQRYTAAHEIGHWILDIDEPAFDAEDDIFYPAADRERLAQLFAGQLLMPPPLVFATCARHGITTAADATGPAVYLVARDMGASYEAAARQLSNLDIIGPADRDALLARTPAQVKTELCHGHRPQGAVDVWPVDFAGTGGQVSVTEGDELVVTLPENRTTGYRWMTSQELAARARRTASPAPASFTQSGGSVDDVPAEIRPSLGSSRSTAAVNRALARVPGNDGNRRILPALRATADEVADVPVASAPVADHDARSALDLNPPSLQGVDDRFTAGWATVTPAAIRSVRRAIAGRSDVALPDSVGTYLRRSHSTTGAVLDTAAIPLAATGERLVALQSAGAGALSLDLTYTSAMDPQAPAAATFHLEVQVAPTPQTSHRRLLLQLALADADSDELDPDGAEPQ